MICRDFFLRVCNRKSCRLKHCLIAYNSSLCNKSPTCSFTHLTTVELDDFHHNVRPLPINVSFELKRLAVLMRQSHPIQLREHCCAKFFIGECIWPCYSCDTATRKNDNRWVRCQNCWLLATDDIKALDCGHIYCSFCMNVLPFNIDDNTN
ncbi:hypothetical protein PUN28_010432 [Cardiocondyla obscurior]|uniref:Uncharacterized protein n=1 Tax=Cardiocondyla obscurior TaxID=286306 RepID=A0AAW2FL57_9HYME